MDDDFYMDEHGSLYDSPTGDFDHSLTSLDQREDKDNCDDPMSASEESDTFSSASDEDENLCEEEVPPSANEDNARDEKKIASGNKEYDEVQFVDKPKPAVAPIQKTAELQKDIRDPATITEKFRLNERWSLITKFDLGPKNLLIWNVKEALNFAYVKVKPVVVKDSTLTHLCILCAELGEATCLYSGHASNRKRHLTKKHVGHEFQFYRIKEMDGKTIRIIDTKKADKLQPDMRKYAGEDIMTMFIKATVKFILCMGLPLNATENPLYRQMIDIAQRFPAGVSKNIGGAMVRASVKGLFEEHWNQFKGLIQHSECVGWSLVFDGWDWEEKYKILGATATVLRTVEAGMELEKYPLFFRLLRGEGKFESHSEEYIPFKALSGAEDMAKVILEEFRKRSVPMDKFVGAKGDGTISAQKCTELLNQKSELLHVFSRSITDAQVETRCVAHALGLVIKGALGYLNPSKDSKIPNKPGDEILALFDKVRTVVTKLSDGKFCMQLKEFARLLSKAFPAISIDMDDRWLSFYHMLDKFLEALPVYLEYRSKHAKNLPEFNEEEVSTLGEIKGLLKPLMIATSFMETSDIPSMPFVLPMLAAILQTYGVLDPINGVLKPVPSVPSDADERKFNVTHFRKDGILLVPFAEIKAVHRLETHSQDFYCVIQKHLIYRLTQERQNKNAMDLAAAWCDPVGRAFQLAWCGEASYSVAEIDEKMQSLVRKFAGIAETSKPAKPRIDETLDSSSGERVLAKRAKPTVSRDCFKDECMEFLDEAENLVSDQVSMAVTIDNIISAAKKLNPLCFWNSQRRRQFPSIFKAAAFAISGSAHTCLQESVFSLAGDTLTQRRKRLAENPGMLEAIVILRYRLNWEQAKIRKISNSVIEEDVNFLE